TRFTHAYYLLYTFSELLVALEVQINTCTWALLVFQIVSLYWLIPTHDGWVEEESKSLMGGNRI
ncbi:hypothetical protein ACJX0J_033245, partial [Zea mays]